MLNSKGWQFIYLIMTLFFVVFSVKSGISQSPKQQGVLSQEGLDVIPDPRSCEFGEKTQIGRTVKIELSIEVDPHIKSILEMGLNFTDEKKGIRDIELELVERDELEFDERQAKEGYKLEIEEKKVTIRAITNAGLFYGAQTLLQMVRSDGTLLTGKITDWPDLQWRAVHFDTKHHQDRFEYYQDIIPKLATYKINAIVFEIEDKLEYEQHPRIGAPGAFSKQQIRQLSDLAKEHYIDFIPLVQGLGHVRYILKHPEYVHLRELPESTWQACPLKDETFDVLFDLYDEAIEATGTETYFHIGGDESYDLASCPDCKKKAEKVGREGIYLLWLNKVADYLDKKDLKVIIWDDMVLKFTEKHLNQLPKNIIYMHWKYHQHKVGPTTLFDRGLKNMVAPATQCTTPIFPDYENRLQNISNFIPSGYQHNAIGELCTAWDDAGLHMETFWLGFIASAEYAWTTEKPGLDEYRLKFVHNFYGKNSEDLLTVYNILAQSGEFFRNSRGSIRWRGDYTNSPIDFPALPNSSIYYNDDWAGFTTDKNKARTLAIEARRLDRLYGHAERILENNLTKDIQNKYNLEVYLSVIRLARLNTHVLRVRYAIAELFTKASKNAFNGHFQKALDELGSALKSVNNLAQDYNKTRKLLKETWEESRYPRDRSDLGPPISYFLAKKRLHFAELSADYDYLFWVEEQIDFTNYANQLENRIQSFKKRISLTDTQKWRTNPVY